MTPKETAILLALGGAAVMGVYLLAKKRTFEEFDVPDGMREVLNDFQVWRREDQDWEQRLDEATEKIHDLQDKYWQAGAAADHFGIILPDELPDIDFSSQKKLMGT